jgi:hypothetical protein
MVDRGGWQGTMVLASASKHKDHRVEGFFSTFLALLFPTAILACACRYDKRKANQNMKLNL